MGIICCLYSTACLPEFLLGVIDSGNSELNIILGEGAGAETGEPTKASSKVPAAGGASGDGYGGGGAATELMCFSPWSFLPVD